MLKKILTSSCIVTLVLFTSSIYSKEFIVKEKDKNFSTQSLKVKLGDKIKFINEDTNVVHNVFSKSEGNNIDLKVQEPGKFSEIYIDPKTHKKGVMELQCAFHPNMKLKVEIE
ncbi:methylamine utilization protein [Silvanigrella paludirubra]|uniref:Methylamine utilization protein n=1 Tax=Silvanigrella paludirubra TaxID=2499159 RepID=A0A6N6VT92_9BACT|nr:plastocyanin/azurin family copper-binding protein [Silvanigrella paludirubra]KAB8039200.1 methylamine utilization protein [Silvanigrella paludirubra]